MVFENYAQPVAPKRRARVLAGRCVATSLPARTRAHRWLHLILKDHYSSLRGVLSSFQGVVAKDMKRSSENVGKPPRFALLSSKTPLEDTGQTEAVCPAFVDHTPQHTTRLVMGQTHCFHLFNELLSSIVKRR